MFCQDINYIHAEKLRNREAAVVLDAYKAGVAFFDQRGVKPEFERLDNETSIIFEKWCRESQINVQFVPPDIHRANKSERHIQKWKNHFIAGLATTDPDFPLAAWDELIEQAELTLNLLRPSAITPRLSAWHQLNGKFSFDRTPLAPPGTKVVVHEKPSKRGSWAPHGLVGFYVGSALKHYRCWRVYVSSTRSVRISDTLSWHPSTHGPLLLGTNPLADIVVLLTGLSARLQDIADNPLVDQQLRLPLLKLMPQLVVPLQSLRDIFLPSSKPSDDALGAPTPSQQQSVLPNQPSLPQQSVREKRVRSDLPVQPLPEHTLLPPTLTAREQRVGVRTRPTFLPQSAQPEPDTDSGDANTDEDTSDDELPVPPPTPYTKPTRSRVRPARYDNNVNFASFVTLADQANAAADIPIDHFLDALKAKYDITTDLSTRLRYIGMTIDYDQAARTITTSVPNYVANALDTLGVARGTRRTDSALLYEPPAQQVALIDDSPLMSPAEIKRLQRICGIFLWYARITDPTMLCPISNLSSDQAHPTVAVSEVRDRFLQYAAWHPDAAIVYRASDMRYVVHSDASYLTEADAHSRAGGIGFLTDNASQSYLAIDGAVECISRIIATVTASICETEYAAQFINGQSAEGVRNTLCDLGYPQSATDLVADNKCAVGIANKTMKQRRSKSIHMQYHWMRDRVAMGHFNIIWKPGLENFADYFTKAHPVHHVRSMRHFFVATPVSPTPDIN